MFIIVEGIDGSGKGTLIDIWKEYLLKKGKHIFDLREYGKKKKEMPTYEEIKKYDVILSAEPTHAWTGLAIRQEIVRSENDYDGLTIAQSYAVDREVLYRRLLCRALKDKKIILQERAFTTSMVYQPLQKKRVALKTILSLPGNRLALKYLPDFLVIAKLPPKEALSRLGKRDHKRDGAIFENLPFITKAQKGFLSPQFKKFFEKRGTKVFYFDTSGSRDKNSAKAVELFKNLT